MTVLQQKQINLISKVLPQEYIDILSDKAIHLFCKALLITLKEYPNKKDGYKLNKEKNNKLYPKLKDIGKPYRLCSLSKLKGVVVAIEPYNNGEATGIPFQFSMDYKATFQLPLNQQDVEVIDETVGLNLKDSPWFGVDWDNLLEQGILVIHVALTSEEGATYKHVGRWLEFTKEFLRCLNKYQIKIKKELVVLSIGTILKKLLVLPEIKFISAPDAYFTKQCRLDFRRFMPFYRLKKAIKQKGLGSISF